MAFVLSEKAKDLLAQKNIEQQIILEIDGFPHIFGGTAVKVIAKIGQADLKIDGSWLIGGYVTDENSKDWVIADKTSNRISQQIQADKGSISSISTMRVSLLDKDDYLTSQFSPGNVVDDVLSKNADIYLGFGSNSDHPKDSMKIFAGTISALNFGAGFVEVEVSHPEYLKKQELFPSYKTKITEGKTLANNSGDYNKLYVDTLTGFITGTTTTYGDVLTGGVRINDELMAATENAGGYLDLTREKYNTEKGDGGKDPGDAIAITGGTGQTEFTVGSTDAEKFFVGAELEVYNSGFSHHNLSVYVTDVDGTTITTGDVGFGYNSSGLKVNFKGNYHVGETDVDGVYFLNGKPIDIALKILLSDGGTYFKENQDIIDINILEGVETDGAILFDDYDIQETLGLVVGDFITITGSEASPVDYTANNVTLAPITGFGKTTNGRSYVKIASGTLVKNTGTAAVAKFKSKYNVLPADAGVGLTPITVDVARHEYYDNLIGTSFPDIDLVITEPIKADELINKKLYWICGLYSVPRKGKVSVQASLPPLADLDTKVIDDTKVLNPSSLKIKRSVNSQFYNVVQYRFAPNIIEDKYKGGIITISADSTERIKVGNRVLKIDADAFQDDSATRNFIDLNIKRLLQKYQYGAEQIDVIVHYSVGYNMDVGDSIIAQFKNLKVTDTINGTRAFESRVMEIQNKTLDIKSGKITLSLVDTIYSVIGRWGTFCPSSKVSSTPSTAGSITTLPITVEYGTDSTTQQEKDKWQAYLGAKVQIRSSDFSYQETATLSGFNGVTGFMEVTDLSGSLPSVGYFIEPPPYNTADAVYKSVNGFVCPQVTATGGSNSSSSSTITVGTSGSPSDADKFYAGGIIRVHNADYTTDSGDIKIDTVDTGTGTIVTKTSIGFTPTAGHLIDLIGFSTVSGGDDGDPFLYI